MVFQRIALIVVLLASQVMPAVPAEGVSGMGDYNKSLLTDSDGKKFLQGYCDAGGGLNAFYAFKGTNNGAQNGETVCDLSVDVTTVAGAGLVLNTRLPATLGQKVKAACLPVVLASDQDIPQLPATLGAKTGAESLSIVHATDQYQLPALGKLVVLLVADPNPAGNDIVMTASAAPASTDFDIRDNSTHWFHIPMTQWNDMTARLLVDGFDQSTVVEVYGTFAVYGAAPKIASLLGTFSVQANDTYEVGISKGTVGLGGVTGASPVTTAYSHYPVPALADAWPYVVIAVTVGVGTPPTTGTLEINVNRRSQ